ncbi:hypothetical protein Cni_G16002 [Canna indica]|uniref:Uncharacterized protein n=1 Tax=Canna indica TaxID=4628 RepID=A0AAQ3KJ69_9LILI|nr:hypothetical protein Cni_G16002 [Canna indica]
MEKKPLTEAEGEMWAPAAAAAGGISGEEAVSARVCRSSSFPRATNASFPLSLSLSVPKMNDGKARVWIPASVRRTIQNFKEIAQF